MSLLLPSIAFSVRQPWAHALAMGWKPVENRSWRIITGARRHVGPFSIHASKGMTRYEYEDARDFIASQGFQCPPAIELPRGGIVGVARVVGLVKEFDSPWFFGPRGIVIADARPVPFMPCGGKLDFFTWSPDVGEGYAPEPAKWMLAKAAPEQHALPLDDSQGRLL